MSLWRALSGRGRAVAAFLAAVIAFAVGFLTYQALPDSRILLVDKAAASAAAAPATVVPAAALAPASHLPTPAVVKGIYMTACIASEPRLRDQVLATLAGTEIDSIVIDLKDYTGTISYASTSVSGPRGVGCRIRDLPAFIADIHARGIYAIARVTVFQDPLYAAAHPEVAIHSRSHPDLIWTDPKGIAYIDPDFSSYWDRIAAIAREGHQIGFDEINFDYVRFPSDGDIADAAFAIPPGSTKADAIRDFFAYLSSTLRPDGIVISADLFGQTTVEAGDMGIGQVLENALPYFDYVSPMDYPSHFIDGFMGYANPAAEPYQIVKGTMTTAVERAVAASSTPDKLRPWLQAFDLGATYTPDMVHDQVRAVNDSGLSSWMLWDAANKYTKAEL